MKILFAIAVLSFAALVWAALAILRHVRKNSARTAAQPIADAELSDALDVRLSELSRQPPGRVAASATVQQDFSYFNRDLPSSAAEKKGYTDSPPPIKPAVADRS